MIIILLSLILIALLALIGISVWIYFKAKDAALTFWLAFMNIYSKFYTISDEFSEEYEHNKKRSGR